MRLLSVPKNKYDDYRLSVIFDGYKWDPQFSDDNTIAKYILVITEREHRELEQLTELLYRETATAEEMLARNIKLAGPLLLPRKIYRELGRMKNYAAHKHIRLMRFDFHPTANGSWAVSEVNSDVPGGFAEASLLPGIAAELLGCENYFYKNFGDVMVSAITKKVKPGGKVMLVHCTSYSDDRQVMQFLGDRLSAHGFNIIYAAADHLRFENHEAVSILGGNTGKVDAIFRFTPIEWLVDIKPRCWQGYFDTITSSCNHPVAVFAQTKRFPLVWDRLEALGVELPTWRKLLPETLEVKAAKNEEGFIYKPACGRVGESISIKEACADDEYEKIMKNVKRRPRQYVAQKKFCSRPVVSDEGERLHVCIGAYSVEGEAAGYYARISRFPRIDSRAADIPVLIERDVT